MPTDDLTMMCAELMRTASDRRLTVPDVLPVLRVYAREAGNGVGGNLHVVLEDGNIGDGDLAWCIDHAIAHNDEASAAIGRVLQMMSQSQRKRLSAMFGLC